jgi:hypothetical protein
MNLFNRQAAMNEFYWKQRNDQHAIKKMRLARLVSWRFVL